MFGSPHQALNFLLDIMRLAIKEITCGLDLFEVILSRDIVHAGCGAVFEVAIEAMFVVSWARLKGAAPS